MRPHKTQVVVVHAPIEAQVVVFGLVIEIVVIVLEIVVVVVVIIIIVLVFISERMKVRMGTRVTIWHSGGAVEMPYKRVVGRAHFLKLSRRICVARILVWMSLQSKLHARREFKKGTTSRTMRATHLFVGRLYHFRRRALYFDVQKGSK